MITALCFLRMVSHSHWQRGGGLKNIDLVKEFEGEGGVWNVFVAGIEDMRVEDGEFVMRLKP